MRYQFPQPTLVACFTISLLSVSQNMVQAAPGTLDRIPLFVSDPIQPNIFFMLDDSGSMNWNMPHDGPRNDTTIEYNNYETTPDYNKEWRVWCRGANLLAYNSTTTYKPWSAYQPGTSSPFPDQTDLSNVWVDPYTKGAGSDPEEAIYGTESGVVNLRNAPVVTWSDAIADGGDGDGEYDSNECPTSFSDSRVVRAKDLSSDEQINFANWFAYYRIRRNTTKAAITQVISTSSARMGMATLHHHNNVGVEIKNMSITSNKETLLDHVVKMGSDSGTPLRQRLDWVGRYFSTSHSTPSNLNIGSASSPILPQNQGGECQQNFVMLMTDGRWNGSSPGVGDQDQTIDNNFVYPAHSDNPSNTLADVAMKWYKTDLAPGLDGKLKKEKGENTANLDENTQQHLVTFGVAFGATGTLNSDPVDRTQAFAWPTPSSNTSETLDDLRHAAYNGRGKFLFADNPEELSNGLQSVLSDIEARHGSSAAVAFNSTSLAAGTTLFFATFNTINWTGNLEAYNLNPTNGELDTVPLWDAASLLDSKSDADIANRVIYTWGLDSGGNKDGVLFNWSITDPQPAAAILDDLKQNQDSTTEDSPFTNSQKRVNFVRGDKTYDGAAGLIRNRASRLGDIVNSAPLYVGTPISNWPDTALFGVVGDRYSNYQSEEQASPRERIVYVGANDGMLHGFRASDGEEVFAYLPSATTSTLVDSGLHYLTEFDYIHQFYVDGTPKAADVYMPVVPSGASDWRTIIVGTLRGGGQGVYALNVSDPSQYLNTNAAAESTVLWEFTNLDDAELGYTFSDPEIVMMNNSKWAVILGNGYNATGTDKAKLMILFIEEGIDGTWSASDYVKIDTKVGSVGNKNGLSTPTLIDLDNNGTIDRVYAGDLHGNMWSFDVSNTAEGSWDVSYGTATTPLPLFAAGTTKPITMKPLLIKPQSDWIADAEGNSPNLMVYFGTGQYVANGDASNTDQQSYYSIWDAGSTVTSADLVQQTITELTNERVLSENAVTYAEPPSTGNRGWFIDLTETGERVVVEAFEIADIVFFNTMTPSEAPCESGGSSWRMAALMKTGGNPDIAAFDINGNGLDNTDTSDGGSTDDDKVSSGGTLMYASGVRFDNGIASATSVITNAEGKSFGYTSGTGTASKQGVVNVDELPIRPSTGGPIAGQRRSWIQLLR